MGSEYRKWKARSVALGSKVKDIYDRLVIEEVIQKQPASLETIRMGFIYEGLHEDGVSLHGDVEGAYLTTNLEGGPKFLVVNPFMWPAEWHWMKPPLDMFHFSAVQQLTLNQCETPRFACSLALSRACFDSKSQALATHV